MSDVESTTRTHRPDTAGLFARYPRLGIVLAAVGWVLFGLMTINLFTQGPLIPLDHRIADSLHVIARSGPAWVVTFMRVGSDIGYFGNIVVIVFFFILWLVRHEWLELSMLLGGAIAGEGLFIVIAGVIQRPRPQFPDPFEKLPTTSFPSGHIVSTVLLYGMLLYLYVPWIRQHWLRAALIILWIVLLIWIAYSRLFLGSHFFTDVIGGLGLGLGWGAAALTTLDAYWLRRRRRQALRRDMSSAR